MWRDTEGKDMIGYVTIGTNDLARAAAFYDVLLAEIGGKRMMGDDNFVAWSNGEGPGIGVTKPYDGKAASVGNGVMVALRVKDNETVDRVYKKALELGGTCEGPAGPRDGVPGFYAGYFRDLDGNKLNVFCMTPAAG